jgi:glycosyltransferase involved in cell wall biosynthesis
MRLQLMKVMYIGLDIFSQAGGIGRYTRRFLQALSGLAQKTIVLSLWDSAVESQRIPPGMDFIPCQRNKMKALSLFLSKLILFRPAVIVYGHIMLVPLAVIGKILSPRSRHVLIVYGIEVWGDGYYRNTGLERWTVKRYLDAIITISLFTQQRMINNFVIGQAQFYLLPPALDLNPTRAASDPLKQSQSVLTVTRLSVSEQNKGVDKVLRALPKVLETYPETVYTVIGEGPLKEQYQKLALDLGIADHVRFLGYVDEVTLHAAYEQSSLFIMPSSKEGFGIVFLEAWQYKLPVICGNRDASAEVVTHDLNGLTVNPDSPEEIAQAILFLLSNPDVAHRMGEEGFKTLNQKYSHATFVETLSRILHEIAA